MDNLFNINLLQCQLYYYNIYLCLYIKYKLYVFHLYKDKNDLIIHSQSSIRNFKLNIIVQESILNTISYKINLSYSIINFHEIPSNNVLK